MESREETVVWLLEDEGGGQPGAMWMLSSGGHPSRWIDELGAPIRGVLSSVHINGLQHSQLWDYSLQFNNKRTHAIYSVSLSSHCFQQKIATYLSEHF